jgi:hypothetical protein
MSDPKPPEPPEPVVAPTGDLDLPAAFPDPTIDLVDETWRGAQPGSIERR